MVGSLIDYYSSEGYNIIIEGTLRSSQVPLDTAQKLLSKGYIPSLYVIAVHSTLSFVSTVYRYEKALSNGERNARSTPKHLHDEVVKNISNNLKLISESKLFKEIKILEEIRRVSSTLV